MKKIIKKFLNIHLIIPFPILGCGVVGLALYRTSKSIGEYASILLKGLEYRGFDSTGAAFLKDGQVTLLKDVGAPSTLIKTLEIDKQEGKLFSGQVRWATFGRVDQVNSQPHVVKCKRHIFGAHNGNITNTKEMKEYLLTEGHKVLSDNDGEIVVHTVEHYFDVELSRHSNVEQNDHSIRKKCMRQAIILATDKLVGSFSAVITEPISEIMYAIKAGSSLYFGSGELEGENFGLASSDLTSLLRFSKNLVEINEGEFIEYTSNTYQVICYKDRTVKRYGRPTVDFKKGQFVDRTPFRSKLRAEDTELLPGFDYFMAQEIQAEVFSTDKLINLFQRGSESSHEIIKILKAHGQYDEFIKLSKLILTTKTFEDAQNSFKEFVNGDLGENYYQIVKKKLESFHKLLVKDSFEALHFFSSEKNTFIDLVGGFNKKSLLVAKALDSIKEVEDVDSFFETIKAFCEIMSKTIIERRNVYVIACGSSYHAALIGATYFNEIAGIDIRPVLPGDFRGQYSKCLRDNDIIIGVSQSGETKDLIDIIDDIGTQDIDVKKIMLVNNMNSTLGQDKSDVAIPILCGPEIAIPATKSFINQIVMFYFLALKTFEEKIKLVEQKKYQGDLIDYKRSYDRRWKRLESIPRLIEETINTTKDSIDRVAAKLYLCPSMEILATKLNGVAKEGALKIRETVLNHAEGTEASEFKHGPNTILGKNTTFGLESISLMTKHFHKAISDIQKLGDKREIDLEDIREIVHALSSYIFERTMPFNLTKKGMDLFKEVVRKYDFFDTMFINYPLVYITGPDPRDINLTISQINTHKIRGSNTFIIAEENDALESNAKYEDEGDNYIWDYIKLPKTGDTLMTIISSTVALQLLSLNMSARKMKYLDKLGMEGHGVHPDVPKNVSKSITVD